MIIRAEHKENFTIIDGEIFENKNLSLKAMGMMGVLLKLPENWDYSIQGLLNILKDGETSVTSALKELEEYGYLKRKQIRENGKIVKWEWIVIEKPNMENQDVENRGQNNINKQSINNNIYCPSDDEQDTPSLTKEQEFVKNFNKIWTNYPRKDGKNKAYQHYKAWIKGRKFAGETKRLTNKEMFWAVKIYAYECDRDKVERRFIQMGSTFFNDTIESKVNRYNKYPEKWEQKIYEWENMKNENL